MRLATWHQISMSRTLPIDEPGDPRVAGYLAIRDRDVAGRPGQFMAEGEVVVRTLLSARSRFPAESLLLAEGRAGLIDRLAADLPPDLPVYVAARPVMDRIVGFPIHRGVLALGRRDASLDPAAILPPRGQPARIVGLIGLANHDNVGAIVRNAAAFAADALLLDRTCCDPLYRKAIRVSAGAALTVPFARGGTAEEMIALLEESGFVAMTLSPSGRTALEDVVWPERAAFLFGTEGPGLPRGLLDATRSIRIDMAPGHDSLNVATAAGIVLHAARPRI